MRRLALFFVILSIFSSDCADAYELPQKIDEARSLLTPMPLGIYAGEEHILLCVFDSGNLRVVEMYYGEGAFNGLLKKQEIIRTATNGCFIEKIGGDGIATNYAVICDERHLPLLAVKRRDRFSKEVVYTPYSDFLLNQKLFDAGKLYLRTLVLNAQKNIMALRVPSRAYPGFLVGEIQQEHQALLVQALIINEHADNYVVGQVGMRPVWEKILATFGANKADAYSYSSSAREALGIGQITNRNNKKKGLKGTYDRAREAYPLADLTADFRRGATDHHNAVKAMFCIIDMGLKELSNAVREQFKENPKNVEMVIPAFYNSGSDRVGHFLAIHGNNLDGVFALPPVAGRHLIPSETWWFLRKHRQIMRLLK